MLSAMHALLLISAVLCIFYIPSILAKEETCTPNPCKNHGVCEISGGRSKCSCMEPFDGPTCEESPCDPNPCQNSGTCLTTAYGFDCICKQPYRGETCEDGKLIETPTVVTETVIHRRSDTEKLVSTGSKVPTNPAKNSSKIMLILFNKRTSTSAINTKLTEQNILDDRTNIIENYGDEEYSQEESTMDTGPCDSKPCKNRGSCEIISGDNFTCSCIMPYGGPTCEISPCDSGPCKNGGTCYEVLDDLGYGCECLEPYSGDTCENSPCDRTPCKNSGTCTISNNTFLCTCPPPYKGRICEETHTTQQPKTTLIPNDPSTSISGGNTEFSPFTADRTFTSGQISTDQYTQPSTATEKFTRTSALKATTRSTESSTKEEESEMTSTPGWISDSTLSTKEAETEDSNSTENDSGQSVNGPCDSEPCKNNGSCEIRGDNFTCSCKEPFDGPTCEKSPCDFEPCKNQGSCKINGGNVTCSCMIPFDGPTCEESPCDLEPCKNNGTCYEVPYDLGYECECLEPYSGDTCENTPITQQPKTTLIPREPSTSIRGEITEFSPFTAGHTFTSGQISTDKYTQLSTETEKFKMTTASKVTVRSTESSTTEEESGMTSTSKVTVRPTESSTTEEESGMTLTPEWISDSTLSTKDAETQDSNSTENDNGHSANDTDERAASFQTSASFYIVIGVASSVIIISLLGAGWYIKWKRKRRSTHHYVDYAASEISSGSTEELTGRI